MIETASGHNQIISDGKTVWVNGQRGECIARLSGFEDIAAVDVHQPLDVQRETGKECLDCRNDLRGSEAWQHFVAALDRYFGIVVDERHRPTWAKETDGRTGSRRARTTDA
jgi:hypothetical protein